MGESIAMWEKLKDIEYRIANVELKIDTLLDLLTEQEEEIKDEPKGRTIKPREDN